MLGQVRSRVLRWYGCDGDDPECGSEDVPQALNPYLCLRP
jgi:hypothetical protein